MLLLSIGSHFLDTVKFDANGVRAAKRRVHLTKTAHNPERNDQSEWM
jgi:hypothetical protein